MAITNLNDKINPDQKVVVVVEQPLSTTQVNKSFKTRLTSMKSKMKSKKMSKKDDNALIQLIWITPALAFIALFIFFSAFIVFKNGFNKFPLDIKWEFTFDVFTAVARDETFQRALINSLMYVAFVVPIGLIFSIGVAKALSALLSKRMFSFLQGIFFLPYVTSAMAVAMAFAFMFSSNDAGIFNKLLGAFGIKPISWLEDPKYAIVTVFIFGIWRSLPFQIVMLTTAFMRINTQYYSAASVDGMKKWKQFWRVSIPQIVPTIIYLVTVGIIGSFKALPLGLFGSEKKAESVNAQTIVFWIYDRTTGAGGIQSNQMAGAASIILLAIILAVTIINRQITKMLNKRYR
ncbi:sn-glycerol-3-phosphate ABC transporter permease [Williamsoniiplasma luminosum]|uniref:Sugar ABC transporter permease n=1 Tax=Williamsoniiplasma luminosum TaxID=214888 RepID=A0A2K8NSU9_9MOLU|nr:sugar ABC transporter permease [Williamsoniiplasma luminosum]ATZ16925.1 sn-glycerol-3-phosphate ABC transporter permease [Williamsoniiplasma luminosum]AVP49591.1 MAG: sugar ABC transporter permease [Williamsoniiplasma luminosum]